MTPLSPTTERLRSLLFSLAATVRLIGRGTRGGSRADVLTIVHQITHQSRVSLSNPRIWNDEKMTIVALLFDSTEPPDLLTFLSGGGISSQDEGREAAESLRKSKEQALNFIYGLIKIHHASKLLQGYEGLIFHAAWGVYRRSAGKVRGISEVLYRDLRVVALLVRLYPELINEQVQMEREDEASNYFLREEGARRYEQKEVGMEEEEEEEGEEEEVTSQSEEGSEGEEEAETTKFMGTWGTKAGGGHGPSHMAVHTERRREIPAGYQMLRVFRRQRRGVKGQAKATRMYGQELKTVALVLALIWEQVMVEEDRGADGGSKMVLNESHLVMEHCQALLSKREPPQPDIAAGIFGAIDRLLNISSGPFENGRREDGREGGREGGREFLFTRMRAIVDDFVRGKLSRYAPVAKILRLMEHHAIFFRACLTNENETKGGGGLMQTLEWISGVYQRAQQVRRSTRSCHSLYPGWYNT